MPLASPGNLVYTRLHNHNIHFFQVFKVIKVPRPPNSKSGPESRIENLKCIPWSAHLDLGYANFSRLG